MAVDVKIANAHMKTTAAVFLIKAANVTICKTAQMANAHATNVSNILSYSPIAKGF
jgi:hypothetical protein